MGWSYSSRYPEPLLDENGNPFCWSLAQAEMVEAGATETASSCFLGKVFGPFEGRNAWQSTWSESSFPLYPTLMSAICQPNWSAGTQATSRYILEYPAIVVAGKDAAVLLIDTHTSTLYSRAFELCEGFSIQASTLSDFLGAGLGVQKVWCARKEATPANLPLFSWHRSREGCRCQPQRADLAIACDFISRVNLHLQESGTARRVT
jgi:hypothetical protein